MSADPRLIEQIQLILQSHPDAATFPEGWEDVGDFDYLYRKNVILVREQDVNTVVDALDRLFSRTGEEAARRPPSYELQRVTAGVRLIVLPKRLPPVPEVLAALDADLGPGLATPDHILYVCPISCTPSEPAEVSSGTVDPDPPAGSGSTDQLSDQIVSRVVSRHRCDGEGVLVSIVDTGLLPDAARHHPWLAGVDGELDDPYYPETDRIRPYAGHGTFAAGCLRCMAPKARVFVERKFDTKVAAADYESRLVPGLEDVLRRNPDIIVFTFTTSTRNDWSLLTFDDLYERRIRHIKGLVVLAPPGNDGNPRWMWPAAYPWVVSVGALSASWRDRAWFSDYGGWIDVYAPGEDLINAFAEGVYVCTEPPVGQIRHFHGMAKWSGTSFAVSIVAGLIAARMSATGENGQQAAASLLRLGRSQAIPGVGAALYPGQACADYRDTP
jgi:Subtilase family